MDYNQKKKFSVNAFRGCRERGASGASAFTQHLVLLLLNFSSSQGTTWDNGKKDDDKCIYTLHDHYDDDEIPKKESQQKQQGFTKGVFLMFQIVGFQRPLKTCYWDGILIVVHVLFRKCFFPLFVWFCLL
jgi:hypothetical protein